MIPKNKDRNRDEIGSWCEVYERELIFDRNVNRKLARMAAAQQYAAADKARQEILKARSGLSIADTAARISERVGPILDQAGRIHHVRYRSAGAKGVRPQTLRAAAEKFGLPEATVDSDWKAYRRRMRRAERHIAALFPDGLPKNSD